MNYFLAILFCGFLFEQQDPESILQIREYFRYVNDNQSKFDRRTFKEMEHSTEGGEGVLYFDEDELVKVSLELFGETGKLERDFYFKKGTLLFVFDQSHRYNMPIYMDDNRAKESGFAEGYNSEKTKIYEDRYYFDEGRLIRWLDSKGKLRSISDSEYSEKEQSLIEHSQELINK